MEHSRPSSSHPTSSYPTTTNTQGSTQPPPPPSAAASTTAPGATTVTAPATRQGRHLHLLAPLVNRTNNSNNSTSSTSSSSHPPVPSIRIPSNPYAGYHTSNHHPGLQSPYDHPSITLPYPHSASIPNSPYDTGSLGPGQPGQDKQRDSRSGGPGSSHSPYLDPSYHYQYHSSYLPGISIPIGYGDRAARSPHPPLTASLRPDSYHLWPPPLPPIIDKDSIGRPYFSSPLNDILPPVSNLNSHNSSTSSYRLSPLSQSALFIPSAPPHLPPSSASSQSHTPQTYRNSPVIIPPPLRFNYSQSPPHLSVAGLHHHFDPLDTLNTMPPRKKAALANSSGHPTPSTPQTVSSTASSRRKQAIAKGNGWTMEHTYDSIGQKKEVIVIDDSESPGKAPRKRTRAQVAAEAAAANGNGLHSVNGSVSASVAGSIKKRKVDEVSEAGSIKKAVKGKASGTATSTYNQQAALAPKQAASSTSTSTSQANPPWDDSEGHYIVKPDDVVAGRYKIVRLLGQGTFGKVVEARNIETRKKVAIKVIRAVQKYRDASKIEIRVLETLKKNDPHNLNKCVHLDEYFDFRNHPCLVTELYGMSVFDFLKQNSYQPFPERHIQDFAKSLLKSVDFLHRLKLVHTDLKPENILLVSNEARLQGPRVRNAKSKSILRNTDIRLIDFGSATFENEYHSSVVSTRHYRAPEIILGINWSYPCDLFSIGCILVEFYTGDALFQTHDNLEHLAMMEVVMGRMPSRMVEKGRLKKPEFFKGSKIDFPNPSVSRSSRKFVKGLRSLADIIPPNTNHNKLFLDLVVRLLDFDPDTRISVAQALHHPYCTLDIPEPA